MKTPRYLINPDQRQYVRLSMIDPAGPTPTPAVGMLTSYLLIAAHGPMPAGTQDDPEMGTPNPLLAPWLKTLDAADLAKTTPFADAASVPDQFESMQGAWAGDRVFIASAQTPPESKQVYDTLLALYDEMGLTPPTRGRGIPRMLTNPKMKFENITDKVALSLLADEALWCQATWAVLTAGLTNRPRLFRLWVEDKQAMEMMAVFLCSRLGLTVDQARLSLRLLIAGSNEFEVVGFDPEMPHSVFANTINPLIDRDWVAKTTDGFQSFFPPTLPPFLPARV